MINTGGRQTQKYTSLGHDEAQTAIEAIKGTMLAQDQRGVIAVADAHGKLLGLLRLDGGPPASVVIATDKAFSAARERKPGTELGRASRDQESGFDMAYYGDSRYIGWGGGLP